MKRVLSLAFIAVLTLIAYSHASTKTYSDSCSTLSLVRPDTGSGDEYFIEASGKANSGYSYYAWFYIDGSHAGTSNSFSNASFSERYGPFKGPHTYKLTIQVGGSMNLCKSSVELTVAP